MSACSGLRDLDFLWEYVQVSEELHIKSRDWEWATQQLDAFAAAPVSTWNLAILLHIAASNPQMTSRTVSMLCTYVQYYSEE